MAFYGSPLVVTLECLIDAKAYGFLSTILGEIQESIDRHGYYPFVGEASVSPQHLITALELDEALRLVERCECDLDSKDRKSVV